jgi:alkaline phosphatase D
MLLFFLSVWGGVCVSAVGGAPTPAPDRRIAFGSCHSQLREGLWDVIGASHPDQLLLLGDNIYADKRIGITWHEATPEQLRYHYCTLNGDPSWQRLVRQIGGYDAILATWDDHDFGINNGDSTYSFRNESREAFLDFFRLPAASPRRQRDGVYTSSVHEVRPQTDTDTDTDTEGDRIFTYKVITLDTRYNMVSATVDPEKANMLGDAQWVWLEAELQDPNVDLVLLGSSIQVLPTGKLVSESWQDHDPKGRERLLLLIANAPCPNIVILSGDIHEAEISQASCLHGSRKLFELTSSGFTHTFNYFNSLITNSDEFRHRGCDEEFNLDMFESGLAGEGEGNPKIAPNVEPRGIFYKYAHSLYEVNKFCVSMINTVTVF